VCKKQGLFQAAQRLSLHYTLSPEDHNKLERINKALTQILTSTDQHYAWYKNSPWSPELHQTFLEHCYWQTELTQKCTCRNYKHVLDSIWAQLETPPPTTGSISHNLRQTQHTLWEIRNEAMVRRESYLNKLAEAASNTNNKTKQKLILHLCTAKQNHKCFTLHHNYMKPQSARGLTRLLIPDPIASDKWLTIIKPHNMEQQLMEYCCIHFQQAQGSPCTVPPLSDLLNYDSLTPFGAQVLSGTTNLTSLDVSPYTRLLLQHQHTWLPADHQKLQPFPFEAMLDRFCKWPEQMSTSPSR